MLPNPFISQIFQKILDGEQLTEEERSAIDAWEGLSEENKSKVGRWKDEDYRQQLRSIDIEAESKKIRRYFNCNQCYRSEKRFDFLRQLSRAAFKHPNRE